MIIQRKTQIILALLVSTIFLFQNCAIIIPRTSQKIPVTSNPLGAKIIVDGRECGVTPLNLELKKRKSHVIRIEKQGYNPIEIRVIRKTSILLGTTSFLRIGLSSAVGVVAGGFSTVAFGFFYWMIRGFEDEMELKTWPIWVGLILGAVIQIGREYSSGAAYALTPNELNVTLTKIEEKPQSSFILIDEEQFQNIKWIRIKCDDSGGEEVINLE